MHGTIFKYINLYLDILLSGFKALFAFFNHISRKFEIRVAAVALYSNNACVRTLLILS